MELVELLWRWNDGRKFLSMLSPTILNPGHPMFPVSFCCVSTTLLLDAHSCCTSDSDIIVSLGSDVPPCGSDALSSDCDVQLRGSGSDVLPCGSSSRSDLVRTSVSAVPSCKTSGILAVSVAGLHSSSQSEDVSIGLNGGVAKEASLPENESDKLGKNRS